MAKSKTVKKPTKPEEVSGVSRETQTPGAQAAGKDLSRDEAATLDSFPLDRMVIPEDEPGFVTTKPATESKAGGETETEENRPLYSDPEWPNWVMKQFTPEEVKDGRPMWAGLKRVVELVLGPIVKSAPTQFAPPAFSTDPQSFRQLTAPAVVCWEATILFSEGEFADNPHQRVFGDIGEVNDYNTEEFFIDHSCATSATKAECRAYRKALRLAASYDECGPNRRNSGASPAPVPVSDPTPAQVPTKETDEQKAQKVRLTVSSLCKTLGIDLSLFLGFGKVPYKSLDQVPPDVAQKMVKALSDWRSGIKEIPKELLARTKE